MTEKKDLFASIEDDISFMITKDAAYMKDGSISATAWTTNGGMMYNREFLGDDNHGSYPWLWKEVDRRLESMVDKLSN